MLCTNDTVRLAARRPRSDHRGAVKYSVVGLQTKPSGSVKRA